MFSVRFTISHFIFSKVFVRSLFHEKIDFLFIKSLKGLPRDAKFGTKLIYWFVEPKNELNSFKFFEIEMSLRALGFFD